MRCVHGAVLCLLALGDVSAYTTLQSGLGGAIGSHYVAEESRMYFVEYDGKLSSYDVVPRQEASYTIPSTTLTPMTSFNLMSGATGGGGHIRWDSTPLLMRPQGNCQLKALGTSVSYSGVTPAYLDTVTFSSAGLTASELTAGSTFAVKNNYRQAAADFDYAKVYVYSNTGLELRLYVTVYKVYDRYTVHGTGYTQTEDIVVGTNGVYAYVTERSGNFLRVRMSQANKDRSNPSAVTVLASGLGELHQIALNDDETVAHVVQWAYSGNLYAIDTTTGAHTVVRTGLSYAVGLLTRDNGNEAFISLQGTTDGIMHYVVDAGTTEYLPFTHYYLFFMTWADDSKQDFFIAQRIYNRVLRVAVNGISDATYTTLSGTVPINPSSVIVANPNDVIVCTDSYLVSLAYNTAFTSAGPLLLGIGHVPKTNIAWDGYATTDAGYFFQVKDAPFGSKVNVMLNHEKARALGAYYYRITFANVAVDGTFNDYKWVGDKFVLTPTTAISEFFSLRRNEDLWYNPYFGATLDTTKFAGGANYLIVRLYTSRSLSAEVSGTVDYVRLFIDNTRPTAAISTIYQVVGGVHTAIPSCGIVEGTSDEFSFDIEANDVDQNMLSWSLSTVWGDNKYAAISSDTYNPGHVTLAKKWSAGALTTPAGNWHATVAGDASSRRCARTFYLRVWDRAINGYSHIHRAVYTKSITLLLS